MLSVIRILEVPNNIVKCRLSKLQRQYDQRYFNFSKTRQDKTKRNKFQKIYNTEKETQCFRLLKEHKAASPRSQGAQDSMIPSLADLRMDSGRGMECLTMAPYSPYSAMTVLRPQHFSLFLHLALRFWNQTCDRRAAPFKQDHNVNVFFFF